MEKRGEKSVLVLLPREKMKKCLVTDFFEQYLKKMDPDFDSESKVFGIFSAEYTSLGINYTDMVVYRISIAQNDIEELKERLCELAEEIRENKILYQDDTGPHAVCSQPYDCLAA